VAVRQLIYTLRFRGAARRIGPDGNVLQIATTATGCTVVSRIAFDGLSGTAEPERGDEARLESELTFTGATTFQETGTIAFGTGDHRLHFSTIGSGHLDPAPLDNGRLGAAIWRVDGGEGQFAGARGLIASSFVVSDAGDVMDNQLGLVYVQ
jgi:hypothetical protein